MITKQSTCSTNEVCKNGILLICLFILSISTIHGQMIQVDKVRNDFKSLLQRPAVTFNPSMQYTSTDSVLIEKGFFYSEETEKVPVLIFKPPAAGVHRWRGPGAPVPAPSPGRPPVLAKPALASSMLARPA